MAYRGILFAMEGTMNIMVEGCEDLHFEIVNNQHIGEGELMSEDHRVLYIWYYADITHMEPGPTDCDWLIPGTVIWD